MAIDESLKDILSEAIHLLFTENTTHPDQIAEWIRQNRTTSQNRLQVVDPMESHKARQRSADFNRRYGAAIRKLRDEAGISQTRVKGITDRHLRRVEQGACRATAKVLRNLATAHGMELNAYMDKLADAMA